MKTTIVILVLLAVFVVAVAWMAARPYMRPAAEAVLPKFAEAVARALRGLK